MLGTESEVCVTEPLPLHYDPAMYIDKPVDDEKLSILNEKWVSPTNFSFPVLAGRKYNPQWENEHSWFRYSVTKNAAYWS